MNELYINRKRLFSMKFSLIFLTLFFLSLSIQLAAQNLYWVGGSGSWNEAAHWSGTPGGAGGAGIPDENTNVYFQNLASETVITVPLAGPGEAMECKDFMWLSSLAGVQLEMVTASFLHIYGDVQLSSEVTYTWGSAFIQLSAFDAATYTIKSASGVVIQNLLVGYGTSASTWQLTSDLVAGNITHISGELDFNNRTITTDTYKTTDDTYQKILNIGNSTLTLKHTNVSPYEKTFEIKNKTNNNFTYASLGSSTINFSSNVQAADNDLMATADMGLGINYDIVKFQFSGRLNAENCHFKTLTSGQIRLNNGWARPAVQGSFYMQNLVGGTVNPAFVFTGNTIDNLNFGTKNNYLYGSNNTIISLYSRGNIFFAGSGNVIHQLTATRWPSLTHDPGFGPTGAAAYANRFFFWDVASAGIHEIKNLVLEGDPECEYNVFWCQQDGSQAEIKTDNPLVLSSVNLKGIIHDPTLLPAKGQANLSIDSGLNQNWNFTTACQPYSITTLPVTGCYDNNDGQISITVDNIRSDLQYQIALQGNPYGTAQTSNTFTGLQQGLYAIRYQEVVNGTPCEAITPYQPALITDATPIPLDGPDTLRLFVNNTSPITQCPDSTDGEVVLTTYNQNNGLLTQGTGNYQFSITALPPPTYNWSSPPQPNSYTNNTLAPGTYYTYAKYDYGTGQECISYFSADSNLIQVTAPPPFDTVNSYATPTTCHGDSDGTAFMGYFGGTPNGTPPPYIHQWSLASPGAPTLSTDAILTGQPAGVYTDTITDANGCRFARNIEITQPDQIDFTVLPNPALGTANLTPITGGNGPAPGGYTYHWTFPDAGTTLSTSPPPISGISGTGQLCCTVTDKNGCEATDCKAFQTLSTPNIVAPPQINCHGGDTTIWVEAVGGSANYIFELFLSDGVTPAPGITPNPSPSVPSEYTFQGVTAGSYKVKVTDGQPTDNFIWSDLITIADGDDVVITKDMANSHDACYGQSNGQIAVTVSNSSGTATTSDYDIKWYDASNTYLSSGPILSGQPFGDYTVRVKHKILHCEKDSTFTISQPSENLVISTIVPTTSQFCYLGSDIGEITVEAAGGTPPYQNYYWEIYSSGSWIYLDDGFGLTNKSGLAAGDYRITVTDVNNCTAQVTHTITAIPAPDPTFTFDVVCPGQITTLTANNQTYIGYEWIVTGNIPPPPFILPIEDIEFDETASPSAQLRVTDVNGCESLSAVVPISHLPLPVVDFTNPSTCLNDNTLLTDLSSGGNLTAIVVRAWSAPTGTPPNGIDPTYTTLFPTTGFHAVTLTVTDAQPGKNGLGCTASLTKNVEIAPLPVADFITPPAFNCDFNEMTLSDNSPASFIPPITEATWTPTPPPVMPSNSAFIAPFEVIVPATPGSTVSYDYYIKAKTISALDAPECKSEVISKNITVPSAIAITGLATSACLDSAVVMWIDSTMLPFTLTDVAQIVWNFAGTSIIANPATSFKQVFVSGFNAPGLKNGEVSLTLINGCTYTDAEIPFMVHGAPTAVITPPLAFCEDENPLTFDGSGSVPVASPIMTWQWEVPGNCTSPILNVPAWSGCTLLAGSYDLKLTVVDANGCPGDTINPIEVHAAPNADFTYDPSDECGKFTFEVTNQMGNQTYRWDFSSGTPLTDWGPVVSHDFGDPGTFTATLMVTDNLSLCDGSQTQTIEVLPPPTVTDIAAAPLDPAFPCGATQFTATIAGGNGTETFLWDFDGIWVPGSNPTNHPFAISGTYPVGCKVVSSNLCESDPYTEVVVIHRIPDVVSFVVQNISQCEYDSVHFLSTSPFIDPEVGYTWNFSGGSPATINIPPLTTPEVVASLFPYGSHSVSLTAYNTEWAGCEGTEEATIDVSPAPIASFDTIGSACLSGPVQFHSTSTVPSPGEITQYEWSIVPTVPGFNQTFTGTPDYLFNGSFPASGAYMVRLVVTTSQSCTDTSYKAIIIHPIIQADFTSENVCFGDQMWFANTTLNLPLVRDFKWTFPGEGTFIGVTPPPVNFGTPGDKAITLEVVDNNGCSGLSTTKIYRVWIPPTTNFTVAPNDTLCLSDTALFTDVSTPGDAPVVNWLWYFGDIPFASYPSSTNTISHHYTAISSYSPTLITTDQNGCQSQVTQYDFVTVVPQPVVSFHPSSPVACSGNEITFFDDSYVPVTPPMVVPITGWHWKIFEPGNPIPVFETNDQNATYTFPVTATDLVYTVRLISYSTYSCADSSDQLYTVFAGPDVQFAIQGQCEGLATSFTNLSAPFGNQWLWDFGENGATSTLPSAIHTYSAPGAYNVSLTVTGSNGCSNTHDTTINIFEKAIANFDFSKVCFGDSTLFNNLSTVAAGSITAHAWNFGDPMSGLNNLSALENPEHLFSAPGLFDVQLQVTDSHDCIADTILQVKVYHLPEAQYSLSTVACADDLVLFDDHSISADTTLAQWNYNFADGNTATLTAPGSNGDTTHRYAVQGQYMTWLKVTDKNGCVDSTNRPITIKPLPLAGFTASDTSCVNGLVFFTDTSFYNNLAVSERRWIFDITNPQQVQLGLPGNATVNHNYLNSGTYQAQLIVTDINGCSDTTLPQPVEVNPGLSFSILHEYQCFNDSTTFEITSLEPAGNKIASVVWQFDENQFSNLESPKYRFPESGPQQVTATVTDTNNCTLTVSHFLTIHPLPEAIAATSLAGCHDSTHFTTTSLPMADSMKTWKWFFGYNNDSAFITSPGNPDTAFLYPPNDSLYAASLVVVNSNGCTDTAFFEVKRFPCVYAEFDTARRYCERQPAWFADQSFSGSPTVTLEQWQWTWGDGTADTTYNTPADTLRHTFSQPGNYRVRLVVSSTVFGELKTDTAYHVAHVNPTPRPDFTQTHFCEKETIQLTAIDTLSTAITQWWIWKPDGGTADTTPVLNHFFADSGYYVIGLQAVSDSGCVGDTLKEIFINPLPELYLTLSDSVVCADTALIVLSDTSANTYQRYEWQPGDGSTIATGSIDSLVYSYPWNDYTAVLTATSAAKCVNSDTATLLVHPLPRAVIDPIPDSVGILVNLTNRNFFNGINSFTLNGASLEQYRWLMDDGFDTLDYRTFHSFEDTGHYVVRLYVTDQFGCTGTDSTLAHIFPEKVYWLPTAFSPNEDGKNDVLRLTGRYFRIDEFRMIVFNRYGAVVFETTEPDDYWDGKVNGEPAPVGMYVVKISIRGLYGERAEETYTVMLIR